MRQFECFGDDRNKGWCVYCGMEDETRDHAPSRVFLDRPYPENLPIVAACQKCNQSFSLDEEYVACLIECAKAGSVKLACDARPKIGKILLRQAALASRLRSARVASADSIAWRPEEPRIRNVVLKLARAHLAFEQNEPQLDEPSQFLVAPLIAMSDPEWEAFETPPLSGCWPEACSRALQRQVLEPMGCPPWLVVQPDRYRYLVTSGPIGVRLVIGEYLAAEVAWR
jgi:hypothetical protein